jgi:hypothetical protein
VKVLPGVKRCGALAGQGAGRAMPPTSGARSGRLGGVASVAARNSRALRAAPRVTPVRVVERSQGKRQKVAAATENGASCAASVANALATTAHVTPEVAALMTAAAQAAVAAVQSQPAACTAASSSKATAASSKATGKRKAPAAASSSGVLKSRDVPPPPAATPAPVSLFGHRRGTEVVTKVKSEYGARKTYDFDDICAICEKFKAGVYKMSDLRKKNDDGTPFFSVPRSSLQFWLDDDDKVQKRKNPPQRGLPGEMHWYVERHVRGRKHLAKPGPGTVLGDAGEKALLVELASKAQKNWAYMEEEVYDLVKAACIELKVLDPKNKKPYTHCRERPCTMRDEMLLR